MVPDELHDFFVASAGVAGALIGLIPGTEVGGSVVALGLIGVVAVAALLVGVLRQLAHEPHLLVVLFAIGIERAWEFVGAKMPGLLGACSRPGGRRITTGPDGHGRRSRDPATSGKVASALRGRGRLAQW